MRWLGTLCLCLRVPCQCACADRTPVHTRRVMWVASAHAKCVAGILEATHHGYVVFRRATKLETERSARRCQIGRHQENEINSGLLKFLQPGRAMVTRINGNLTQPYSHPNMLLRWD